MNKKYFHLMMLVSLLSIPVSVFSASYDTARSAQGLKIAPVTLNATSLKNKKLKPAIGIGSYIVNTQAACADCHSSCAQFTAGHNPYRGESEQINTANYLTGGLNFQSYYVATNLTPDAQGLPGGLTQAQFTQVMQTGRGHQGNLLQQHPSAYYNKMIVQDIQAIYEYLRALPSQPMGPQADYPCQ